MQTMYDKLLMLPVFKGMGAEQLSSFLEKTQLGFNNYEAGATIRCSGDICDSVTAILSGDFETVTELAGGVSEVICSYGPGKVIGLEHLFGMDNHYSKTVKAVTDCGTMSFSKAQYMDMLQSNSISMINFLNYLSLKAQRLSIYIDTVCNDSLTARLATIISLVSDRDVKSIRITDFSKLIENICHATTYTEDVAIYRDKGIAGLENDDTLIIPSRVEFLAYAENL